MTIHSGHPFADPEPDPVRRLRGRVGATVSLWTTGSGESRAGLTVSSYVVVVGEPGRIVGMVGPDSDLAAVVEDSGRVVVQLLAWRHRRVSEAFGGQAPAPGGPFRLAAFEQTAYGPLLSDASARALCRLESARELGWSRELVVVIDEVEAADSEESGDARPLVHRRGRYLR